MKLNKMEAKLIDDSVKSLINTDKWQVIVTLTEGDAIFGDLHYMSTLFSGTPEQAEKHGLWIPDKWKSPDTNSHHAIKIRPICLVFNSKTGTKNGLAYRVEIKDELISGIRPLSWTEKSLSSQPIKNIPNPLASLICEHNFITAKKYSLSVSQIREYALPESAVPPEGIEFNYDEIIYADWEFFTHISGGSLSLGWVGINYDLKQSLNYLVQEKIKNGITEKVSKFFSGKTTAGEYRLQGFIDVPETPITTVIEGCECVVVVCTDNKKTKSENNVIPVLLKKNAISYPIEFLPFINSELIFYGEMKQIPIQIGKVQTDKTLLARAIGFITDIIKKNE